MQIGCFLVLHEILTLVFQKITLSQRLFENLPRRKKGRWASEFAQPYISSLELSGKSKESEVFTLKASTNESAPYHQ